MAVANDDKVEISLEPRYNELVIQISSFKPNVLDPAPFIILDPNDVVIYDPDITDTYIGKKVFIRNIDKGLSAVTLKY